MSDLMNLLESKKDEIRAALGAKRDFGTWWSITQDWVARTEDRMAYKSVGKAQVIAAFKSAAKLGLLIDGAECLVNVRGKDQKAQIKCEVGYKGIVRMAGQSGTLITAHTVHEGDVFDIDEGAAKVMHKPAWTVGAKSGKTLGHYAIATYRDGRRVVKAVSLEAVDKRRRDTDAWKRWEDEMGEKTAINMIGRFLHFGDDLDRVLHEMGVGFESAEEAREEAERDEPQHPPKTARDRVIAAARRQQQDEDAEQGDYDPSEDLGSDPI